MRRYFDCSDDFFCIINSHFKTTQARLISTGWTNFVYEAKTAEGDVIFRFPRNDFFADAMEKECHFLQSISQEKLSVKLPQPRLDYFEGRPFSYHFFLEGSPLSDQDLSANQQHSIFAQTIQFLREFGFILPKIPLPLCSEFLEKLSYVPGNYNLEKHSALVQAEKEGIVLSHGDFNPGNILIKDGKVSGIIDFAFVSYSSPLNDISRLIGRAKPEWKNALLEEYQKVFGRVEEDKIDSLVQTWKYVDQKYIEHIKKCHPEIELREN